ncbi:Gfo/Idh/MocA family protein, partial [Yersinia pestis]|uniref:Gfo/Idh/MocA family protein n=2 Tax=Yersinia pestis TaxID=632 RepID=UPI0005788E80
MKEVRIGLIGTGYIGKAHAIAYAQAPTVFELRGKLVREMVAEVSPALAAQRAQAFGFNRFTCDWRELVADPAIDVVDICSPNYLHKEMALAAIHHGKHVYAEKPLALNARDASEMAAAATRAGVKTLVGFNYIKNPSAKLAKEIIERGEIGEVIHFYGTHNEDYMADPNTPIHWHCLHATAGLGALGDLAAHIVSMAQYLVGEITQVCGDLKTVVVTRPASVGSSARVAGGGG